MTAPDPLPVPRLLTAAGVIHRIYAVTGREIRRDTWSGYVSRGQAPKPHPEDALDGRTPRWRDTAVDAWIAGRRGQGARTDKRKKDDVDVTAELSAAARRIASIAVTERWTKKQLEDFHKCFSSSLALRERLLEMAVDWAIRPLDDTGPLVSEQGFLALFDPVAENPGWYHRGLLHTCVLEQLARSGWRPTASDDPDEDPEDEPGGGEPDPDDGGGPEE